MSAVFYDPGRNTLYVSGIATPFPAGSLQAQRNGLQLSVANPLDGTLLCNWSDYTAWTIQGVNSFPSIAEAFALLQETCSRKRPVGSIPVPYPLTDASSFSVDHGLSYAPHTAVVSADGAEVDTDVIHVAGRTTLIFAAPFTGTLYLG